MKHTLQNFVQQAIFAAKAGKFDVALALWKKVISIEPNSAELWFNYGETLVSKGLIKEGYKAFLNVLQLASSSPEANNAVAFHFLNMGYLADAQRCLQKALQISPGFTPALVNLGLLHEKSGELPEAESAFRRALDLAPNLEVARSNLGGILNAQKRHKEAFVWCESAVSLNPNSFQAWSNLGAALIGLQELEQARAALGEALKLNEQFAPAWSNMGALFMKLKSRALAAECFEKAMTLDPANQSVLGTVAFARLHTCSWSKWSMYQSQVSSGIEQNQVFSAPFPALSLFDSSAKLKALTELYVQSTLGTVADSFISSRKKSNPRVRLGYFSADFREHPVGLLLVDLLKSHDRSQFELVGFAFSSESSDAMGTVFQGLFDQYHDVREASDEELIHLARSCELDLAIDLGGYTAESRPQLFAARVAPVQISYLGFPGTMAMPSMDYLIADKRVIPETDFDFYSEKLIHLPRTFFPPNCYHAPSGLPMTRVEQGLPDSGFVFACFNNSYKINPDVFDAWMSILRDVPNSVIWLSHMDDDAKANLRREAEYRGVDSGRLVFACRMQKREDHLERIRLADLFLDTWPYGAHTTASDALWVGLPVLTIYGKTFAGRVASSLLSALGLQDLVASTVAEYKSMAVGLAEDKPHLLGLRSQLLKAGPGSPVHSPVRYVRSLEKAYMAAHKRCENGLEPTHLEIED